MDKYEYKVKLAQIEKLAAKKDYVTAAKVADGIDWTKVKSASTLHLIADVYEANDRLEDCYELLNMVYDRSPVSRRIVYHMAEVATKMHDFEEAIDLYKEFVKLAPRDLSRYILKYQIYRERGSSVEDQIVILEEYKSYEYDEKWAYELACLYDEAGMIDRCVEECDELILWFSEGEYVAKAMELKLKYQELTASQQEKFEHRYDYLQEESAEYPEEEPETDAFDAEIPEMPEETVNTEDGESKAETAEETDDTPQVSMINTNKFSTMNLQEELAKGLQMILAQEEAEKEEAEEAAESEPEPVEEAAAEPTQEMEAAAVIENEAETEEIPETPTEDTQEFVPVRTVTSETAELKSEILKYVSVVQEPKMEELLRTEEDGQISLAIGEENILEKQITGQMTIEEILEAWEEKKRQAKEKGIQAEDGKKNAVLLETGEIASLLEDFIPRMPKEEEISEELEDDLPQDIDLAEALESALAEPEDTEDTEDTEEELEFENPEELLPEDTEEEPEQEAEQEQVTQSTASMLDAIERALAMETMPTEVAGKYLSEEQEKIFAYFTSVNGMKKQLVTLLSEDSIYAGREDSKVGNLVITGHPGNGKTTLAIDMVKAFQKQRQVKGGKLAKVSGDGLNKKEPEEVVKKLGGGALIIEHAGGLDEQTIEKLSTVMEGETGGLLVILEDEAAEIAKLMEKNQSFAYKFNRSIDIPIFSNDELVAFGKSYAEEQEYYFDEMAVLALYDCIGVRQTSDHVVNIAEVKEFVDDAIEHADKKSRGLFARLSKKRIDEEGNRLLLEEDFDY